MDVFEDDLSFAASVYTVEQVQPRAEKCLAGRCKSYVHCFYGRPRKDGSVPFPVCARSIMQRLEQQQKG